MLRNLAVITVVVTLFVSVNSAYANEMENLYGELLRNHVHEGKVDYLGLKQDETKLDQYLNALAETNPEDLSSKEQLAYYINGYNAYTIKLILMHFKDGNPVSSIKKIGGIFGSPWSKKFAVMGGETLTLDTIEHDIIRPTFKDPRVHFAINCASKSCPPLINKPYTGTSIDEQLTINTEYFLNNPKYTYLKGNTLYLSKIFLWFKKDFNKDPVGFVRKYAKGKFAENLNALADDVSVIYLDYDWSLNNW